MKAVKFKGEIQLPTGEILVMDFLALTRLEEATGVSAFTTIDEIQQGRSTMTDMIHLFRAAMLRNNPDATFEDAADLYTENSDSLIRLIEAASPSDEKVSATTSKKK